MKKFGPGKVLSCVVLLKTHLNYWTDMPNIKDENTAPLGLLPLLLRSQVGLALHFAWSTMLPLTPIIFKYFASIFQLHNQCTKPASFLSAFDRPSDYLHRLQTRPYSRSLLWPDQRRLKHTQI